jgi:hypothetical protein
MGCGREELDSRDRKWQEAAESCKEFYSLYSSPNKIFNLSNETKSNKFCWVHHVGRTEIERIPEHSVDYRHRGTESSERRNISGRILERKTKYRNVRSLTLLLMMIMMTN